MVIAEDKPSQNNAIPPCPKTAKSKYWLNILSNGELTKVVPKTDTPKGATKSRQGGDGMRSEAGTDGPASLPLSATDRRLPAEAPGG